MRVSLIAAMDRRGTIGTEAGLPWQLPSDLKRFRQITWGKPIVMGRKTFSLIGRALPGRHSIVLTHNPGFQADGAIVAGSPQEALRTASRILADRKGNEVVIIGGAEVYRDFLRLADYLYLTVVEGTFRGNVFFPREFPPGQHWVVRKEERLPADEQNPHAQCYYELERLAEPPANGSAVLHDPLELLKETC